jgi:hypothetical protein
MTQLYRITLLKKLISIAEMMQKNDDIQGAIVTDLNRYDKLSWIHPLRLTTSKEKLVDDLEQRILVGHRINRYYQDTLTKLNQSK